MAWIQPTFSQDIQPKKKQRIEQISKPKPSSYLTLNDSKSKSNNNCSWIEKYKPNFKHELIVRKNKVDEVESWLRSLDGEGAKILLLTGPSGSGKLTTLKVLCKDLKIQISEWITPPTQEYDPENFTGNYCSQQRCFEEFLIRASRYGSVLSSCSKRIVVVKDIPTIFIKDPTVCHELLKKFNDCDGISVVFIITDSSLILDLFPEAIKNILNIKTINFNPITKKAVSTFLTNIVRNERLNSSLDLNVVSDLSETCDGDLRNAISSLNFISTKGSTTKRIEKKNKLSKVEPIEDPLKKLTADSSIDLFHGLGRVLYSKRNKDGQLTHNPNGIVDSFTSNTNTFISLLHENYLNIFSDINSVSSAANYLATSDFILHDMNDTLLSRDLSMSTTVRGLMYANRAPLKKFNQFNKSKNSKATNLMKSYNDCIKANFYSSNPKTILLDSITYLNKMSKHLDNDSQRNVVKELSCFYLMDKNS